jgi:pilus assembly protein CpaC
MKKAKTMSKQARLSVRITTLAAAFGAAFWLSTVAVQATESTYSLATGTQRAMTVSKPVTRVAVGDPEVAGVSVTTTKSLLITGKKAGSTSLLVWQKGEAEPRQFKLVVSPVGLDLWPSLKMAAAGQSLAIEGRADSLEDHAEAVAAAAKPAEPRDVSETAFDNQVQISIKIVEVSRTKMMEAGFFLGRNQKGNLQVVSGPGSISGVSSSSSGSGSTLGGAGFAVSSAAGFLPSVNAFNIALGNAGAGLLGVISLLESNGFAYTLASPTLTVLSGQSASFLAGGEIPIPTSSGSGSGSSTTISYREFGVKLQIAATVLGNNRIALKVAPEVSEPNFAQSVQSGGVSVPSFNVRKTETSVLLGNGESFVISGLFSRNVTNNVDKLPGLGELPIIGAFFRNKELQSEDKELMMVVTTNLVRPLAAGAQVPALPGENLRNYKPGYGEYLFDAGSPGEVRVPVGMSQ